MDLPALRGELDGVGQQVEPYGSMDSIVTGFSHEWSSLTILSGTIILTALTRSK